MTYSHTDVRVRPDGKLVPTIVGKPNDHIMDWRGCNFHRITLPGWKRGHALENTPRNQLLLTALLRATSREAIEAKIYHRTGTWCG